MPRALVPVLLLAVCLTGCTAAHVQTGFVLVDDAGDARLGLSGDEPRLVGALGRELVSLEGARVKVWATGAARLRVLAYQVLDVGNGFAAYVGWISVDQAGVRLVESSGRTWVLVDVDPEEFREHHGYKLWVTGLEEGGDALRPLGWGRIEHPDQHRQRGEAAW